MADRDSNLDDLPEEDSIEENRQSPSKSHSRTDVSHSTA